MRFDNLRSGATASGNLLGAVLLVTALAAPIRANMNLITNGLLEGSNPTSFQTLYSGSTVIPAWTVGTGNLGAAGSGSVDWIGTYWQGPPPCAGSCLSVDLDGLTPGSIYQQINTTAGQSYVLTFWMSGNPDGLPDPKVLNVSAGSTSNSYDASSATDFIPNWVEQSFSFTAGAGTSTLITFASGTDPASPYTYANNAYGPVVGDISVYAATPEPGMYWALGLALCGLAALAFRRRLGSATSRS